MAGQTKSPVTKRALRARINRALEKRGRGERLCANLPGSAQFAELGALMLVQQHPDGAIARAKGNIDLEEYAREIGVLQNWERVV